MFGLRKKLDINAGVESFRNTKNAMLLDVRTEEEYAQGHIKQSINLPLQKIEEASLIIPDLATPLFVYCRSGARSETAVNRLRNMGYTNAENIGGIIHYHNQD